MLLCIIVGKKNRPHVVWHIKIELMNQDKWHGHDSPSSYLKYIFVILPMIAGTEAKYIYDNLTKKIRIWNRIQLHLSGKK